MTVHELRASERTVRVGVIDAAHEPVLAVDSGDEVVFETWQLWGDAVTPGSTFDDIVALRARWRGHGPHSITGPVEVRGARPGMVLRVDVLDYRLRDHGFNVLLPRGVGRGLLADDFDGGQIRHFRLDTESMTTTLGGVTIALRPFLGIMGVAPAQPGPHNSAVPGDFGGNMDCNELVAGSSLFLPVWVDGARFYAGDAHAAQGCGEVNQTALETAMQAARLRLTLVEDEPPSKRPRIETPTHLVTMGFDADLREAARQAVRDLIELLVRDCGLDAQDAYVLCSLQADLAITQLVNGNCGVHARIAKQGLPPRRAAR